MSVETTLEDKGYEWDYNLCSSHKEALGRASHYRKQGRFATIVQVEYGNKPRWKVYTRSKGLPESLEFAPEMNITEGAQYFTLKEDTFLGGHLVAKGTKFIIGMDLGE